MASQHIEITGNSTRLNAHLRAFVDLLQRVQDAGGRIKATCDQAAMGDDWEGLRDALGLEQTIAGTQAAQAIYNLIGSVQGELDGPFINQLLGRLG